MAKRPKNKKKNRGQPSRTDRSTQVRKASRGPSIPSKKSALRRNLIVGLGIALPILVVVLLLPSSPEKGNGEGGPDSGTVRAAAPAPERAAEKSIEARLNEAMDLQRQGRFGEAIARYSDILADAPDNLESHNNLGNLYARTDRFDEAARHFENAIQLDPANARVRYNLGNVYLRQGENHKALAAFERAVELDPAFEEATRMIRMIKGG